MKLIDLIWFFPISICLFGALFLAYHEKEGWGWLLFIALFLIPSKKECDNKTTEDVVAKEEKENEQ
jgi:hypothetical protein